jgi:hypothetical protein
MDKKRYFVRRLNRKSYRIVNPENFSEIESSPTGIKVIRKLVAEAGRDAASQARAVGIPRVFARGNQLFEEFPDGRTEIVPSQFKKTKEGYFLYKKLGTLHARKK